LSAVLRDLKNYSPQPGAPAIGRLEPRPPSSVPVFTPEAAQGIPRPVLESALAGLPALQTDVAAAVNHSRQAVRAALPSPTSTQRLHLSNHSHVSRYHGSLPDDLRREDSEKPRQGPEAAAAGLLGRKLTPSERLLARAMRARGQASHEVAANLRLLEKAAN